MTCIVAIPNGRTVLFAADSANFDHHHGVIHIDPRKVFTVPLGDEKVGFGCAGDSSLGALIVSRLVLPAAPTPGEEGEWAQAVAEQMTEIAIECKVVDSDNKVDGFVLLAFRGCLWSLYDYYAMPIDGPTAIGCGAPFALGALAASAELSPRRRAKRAVKTACRFNPFCRPPVVVTEV